MTESARVVAVDGKKVSVIPLNIEVCLGCSNEECRSGGSLFTVVNRRDLPVHIGSEVRIGAPVGRQVIQGLVSIGIPVFSAVMLYSGLPHLFPSIEAVIRSGAAIVAALAAAVIVSRVLSIGDAGFPEITGLID